MQRRKARLGPSRKSSNALVFTDPVSSFTWTKSRVLIEVISVGSRLIE
jgi:hypothetical protein